MIWHYIGMSAAMLTTFSFVPQIFKVIKTRSVNDVSLVTLFQFAFGVILWAIYGIHLKNPIIIAANIITLVTLFFLIGLYFKFRDNSLEEA